jgi:hypothetical protein
VETALTAIVPDVPVIEEVTVSVAVMVWLPGVLKVAVRVPETPLANVVSAGRTYR